MTTINTKTVAPWLGRLAELTDRHERVVQVHPWKGGVDFRTGGISASVTLRAAGSGPAQVEPMFVSAVALARIVGKLGPTVDVANIKGVGVSLRGERTTVTLPAVDMPARWHQDEVGPVAGCRKLTPGDVTGMAWLAGLASPDISRPILTHICLRDREAAATDSFVLGLTALEHDGPQVLLPAWAPKWMTAGTTLYSQHRSDIVCLGWRTDPVDGITIDVATTTLAADTFPRYDTILPAGEPVSSVTVDRAKLVAALKETIAVRRAAGMDDIHPAMVRTTGGEATFTTSEMGRVVGTSVPCVGDLHEQVGLNPAYLLRGLVNVPQESELVILDVWTNLKPFRVVAGRHTFLQMPIRVA